MASDESNWDNLPKLAAFSILDRLYEVIDRIRFGVVSTSWHIIAEEYKEINPRKKEVPMLMVPATNNHNKRRLYSILQHKTHSIHLSVPFEICIGSCYGGWLAFANHKTLVIKLINPFKSVDPILLPPLEWEDGIVENSSFNIKKVILSADPLVSPDYVVLTVFENSGRLRIFKSGKNNWGSININNLGLYSDFILCKNIFYVVNVCGGIMSLETNSIDDYDKLIINILHLGFPDNASRIYVVESSKGDILMVKRYFVEDRVESGSVRITNSIKVYKLVLDPSRKTLIEFVEVTSLDGDAIFVGFNYTCCISASDFPNCSPNSIYFTNDFTHLRNIKCGPCDLGVYNIEDKTFGEHYKLPVSHRQFSDPLWVFPPV